MKPYKPSNRIDKSGWQWLALTSGLGGITLGGINFLVSQVFYLVMLMPIPLGVGSGWLLRQAVYRGKVRHPLIAGSFALATGVLIYGTMHAADYLGFRQNATREINRALSKTGDKLKPENTQSNSAPEINVDRFLVDKTGSSGFIGFLRYRSQQGLIINPSSLRIPLNPNIVWGYWGLEVFITSAIALGFAVGAARKPFCENCRSWYSGNDRLGRIYGDQLSSFLEAMDSREDAPQTVAALAHASSYIDPLAKVYPPSLEAHLEHCATCQSTDGVLFLSRATIDKNGATKFIPLSQGVISPEQELGLVQNLRNNLDLSLATLGEQESLGQSQLFQQIARAQQERSTIDRHDTYTSHDLTPGQIEYLQQQLATYPRIKKAYLVKKVVQILPEKPFYVLGVIRSRGFLESATAQVEGESRLGNDLTLPGQFAVVLLNESRRLHKKIRVIEGAEIYTAPSKKSLLKFLSPVS